MSTIGDALVTIEGLLRTLGRPVVDLLQPGLPPDMISRQLVAHGLPIVPDVLALYGWHNGTDVSHGVVLDDVHMVPGFYFASLEEALANLESFRKSPRWHSGWLPVFANGGGDFLVVSCDVDRGAVRHFRIEQADHPIEYATLADFAKTIQLAIAAGVIFVDDDGYLEQDDAAFATMAARVNPDVPWWNDPI
jgi:hypothetical protein